MTEIKTRGMPLAREKAANMGNTHRTPHPLCSGRRTRKSDQKGSQKTEDLAVPRRLFLKNKLHTKRPPEVSQLFVVKEERMQNVALLDLENTRQRYKKKATPRT